MEAHRRYTAQALWNHENDRRHVNVQAAWALFAVVVAINVLLVLAIGYLNLFGEITTILAAALLGWAFFRKQSWQKHKP